MDELARKVAMVKGVSSKLVELKVIKERKKELLTDVKRIPSLKR